MTKNAVSNLPDWTDLDDRAVAIARALAMDSVQRVGNGHPGTAMSLAPVAYTLFQRILKHDPTDPEWIGRDRFILSCGHSSLTLYIQLLFSGYGLSIDDLKSFRTWGSLTPGHPEYGHTKGVETTTGPLGQGIANAVGMAMAARYKHGLFDPESDFENSPFGHNIWVICSDGDVQEGVSAEASSLAGTQALGNLKVIYDDNRISIDGDTHNAFTEDVSARYRSYGWNVIEVSAKSDGDVDRSALERAMIEAVSVNDRPTLIRLQSVIAWPAPKARNTAKSHGSALGKEEVAATKIELGLPAEDFYFPTEIESHVRKLIERNREFRAQWDTRYENWRSANPKAAALLDRMQANGLPENWKELIPVFENGKEVATRKASGEVINKLATAFPEMLGGSADLAESNNTTIEGGGAFLPSSSKMAGANPFGRNIFFGIREHAMGAIINGMALHGGLRPFAGTFLVFSDYMRGAVRLSALMQLPVTFIWTHDSIGLGEDGPTHQPIEHLASLRAMPGLDVIRPADANETSFAWLEALRRKSHPTALVLSRQNLPILERGADLGPAELVAKGGYVYADADNKRPDVIIIGTGSELQFAVEAKGELDALGVAARVVSMPCVEWFEEQEQSYKNSVLDPNVKNRISIEAGLTSGWREIVGDKGISIGINHYGASADYKTLFKEFGITTAAVVNAAKDLIGKK